MGIYNNVTMSVRAWFQPGYRLLLMFFATTSILVSALAWMGWKLIDQERLLARQQIEDRCEHAADLAAAALKEDLSGIEARLMRLSVSTQSQLQEQAHAFVTSYPEDSALLIYSVNSLQAYPAGRLLFFSDESRIPAASGSVFAPADSLEFEMREYLKAAKILRALVQTRDPAIRAEALARLGRCLWKAGRVEEALVAYHELEGEGSVSVGGLPAELAA